MSTVFLDEVENCATALAGHRAAILFNFSLTERQIPICLLNRQNPIKQHNNFYKFTPVGLKSSLLGCCLQMLFICHLKYLDKNSTTSLLDISSG